MALHKDHEQLARAIGNEVELVRGLGNQALILKARGDFGGAMILHKQEENLSRQLGDMRTLGHSLANQANILIRQREADRALALHKEAETIYREMGDQAEIAKCLTNQALILALDKGQARGALPLAEKAYRLASRHNQTALTDQIKPMLDIVRSRIHAAPATEVDIPASHPGANPAQLNIKYQQEITRWKALPWWGQEFPSRRSSRPSVSQARQILRSATKSLSSKCVPLFRPANPSSGFQTRRPSSRSLQVR